MNLSKLDGPDSDYWLHFPDYDVKNRVKLDYRLEGRVTKLIDPKAPLVLLRNVISTVGQDEGGRMMKSAWARSVALARGRRRN